jgi:hypothetical protein
VTSAPRRLAALLAGALLLLPATTACSPDGDGPTASDETSAPESTPPAPEPDPAVTPAGNGPADPDKRLDFTVVESATADLTSDNPSCAVVRWSPNETGVSGQVDFRQLDCYGDQDAVDIGLPALLQTIIWVEMPSADQARSYAQDNLYDDKQALVAGPTALVINGLWGQQGTDLYAEIQAACGCGELVSAAS